MKEGRKKVLISIFFMFTLLFMVIYNFIKLNSKKQIEEKENINQTEKVNKELEVINVPIKENDNEAKYPKEQIIEEYKGYTVCAKLEIPNIKLETYILKNYSIEALNISVTKFWGVNPNETGNCCIAGHNFKNKNMFRNLKKLEIGDTFTISDNNIGKVEYEIFDIYTVFPKDTSCLNPETENQKEVTLITCTSDSKKRIIVKAKEII